MLVESLMDRLKPPMRAALVLRELDGLDYEDIARALRIPVGTVRSRLSSARSQFRVLWLAAQEETRHV
jgi:RNA polymerase sigma-70 factor (ECF subfamily)